LIQQQWLGLTSKDAFAKRQEQTPVLLAMGRVDQARLVTKPAQ